MQRFVERIVENGQVVRDLEFTTFRPSAEEFLIQGYNHNVPFVATNMTPEALQKVYLLPKKSVRANQNKSRRKSGKRRLNRKRTTRYT